MIIVWVKHEYVTYPKAYLNFQHFVAIMLIHVIGPFHYLLFFPKNIFRIIEILGMYSFIHRFKWYYLLCKLIPTLFFFTIWILMNCMHITCVHIFKCFFFFACILFNQIIQSQHLLLIMSISIKFESTNWVFTFHWYHICFVEYFHFINFTTNSSFDYCYN